MTLFIDNLNQFLSDHLGMSKPNQENFHKILCQMDTTIGQQPATFLLENVEDYSCLGKRIVPLEGYSLAWISDSDKTLINIWKKQPFSGGSCKEVLKAAQVVISENGIQFEKAVAKQFIYRDAKDENLRRIERGYAVQKELANEGKAVPRILTPFFFADQRKTRGIYLEEDGGNRVFFHTIDKPLQKKLGEAIEICSLLKYVHGEKGWIHGDIWGENVISNEEGHLKIIDWDLAMPMHPISIAEDSMDFNELPILNKSDPFKEEDIALGENDIGSLVSMFGYNYQEDNDFVALKKKFNQSILEAKDLKEREVLKNLQNFFEKIILIDQIDWKTPDYTYHSASQVKKHLQACLSYLKGETAILPDPNVTPKQSVRKLPVALPFPEFVSKRPSENILLAKKEFFTYLDSFNGKKMNDLICVQRFVKERITTHQTVKTESPISR